MLPPERPAMKRPVGVTVMAVLNICGAGMLAVSDILLPAERPHGAYLGILIADVLFSVALSVGLLKLKNWARSITVLFSWFNLFGAVMGTTRAVLSRQGVAAVGEVFGGLFAGWMLWYLSRSEVIAAFRLQEILSWRESLSIIEGPTAIPNSTKQDIEPSPNETNPVSITLFGHKTDMRD